MSYNTRKWLLILACILISVFLFFKINARIKIVELTSIEVNAEAPLENDKVKVYQGFYSINRENDSELFNYKHAMLIYDRKDVGKIKTEYGENDFLVIYDSKYYFQFRQFSTNDNDYFNYRLLFYKKSGDVFIRISIGNQSFERPMNLISEAAKLRCNNPIDETKVLYNGVELK